MNHNDRNYTYGNIYKIGQILLRIKPAYRNVFIANIHYDGKFFFKISPIF